MSRISAGGNLSIDIQPTNWRLLANGIDVERALLEAAAGEPLRYVPAFGSTRRLPDTGVLPTQYIQRVVLGWSQEDESWHLGFLLEPLLAAPRGSRWCEVAYWHDPDRQMFEDAARTAGETLAQAMTRPFHFVPPVVSDSVVAKPAAPAPLRPLPAALDEWAIRMNNSGQIEAALPSKGSTRIRRAVWYGFLSVVYFALSGLTLTSGIALPRPEWLPWLGVAAAIILLLLAIRTLLVRDQSVNRIVVHPEAKVIRGSHDRQDRWRYEADEIKSVYVSQLVQKPRRNGTQAIPYGELNLELTNGTFQYVLQQGSIDVAALETDTPLREGAALLQPQDTHTDLQILALHIARMLNVPCIYDLRRK
jgi:hypothetical protein